MRKACWEWTVLPPGLVLMAPHEACWSPISGLSQHVAVVIQHWFVSATMCHIPWRLFSRYHNLLSNYKHICLLTCMGTLLRMKSLILWYWLWPSLLDLVRGWRSCRQSYHAGLMCVSEILRTVGDLRSRSSWRRRCVDHWPPLDPSSGPAVPFLQCLYASVCAWRWPWTGWFYRAFSQQNEDALLHSLG